MNASGGDTRPRPRTPPTAGEPEVAELLDVDREYREGAQRGRRVVRGRERECARLAPRS